MRILISADFHLTDRESDAYRWKIFDFLRDIALKYKCGEVAILGDLTDKRDNHSATLVNKLVLSLQTLIQDAQLQKVTILGGNHDKPFGKDSFAYFDFFSELRRTVNYLSAPASDDAFLFLPFSKDPENDWKGIPLGNFKCILMHQAVEGAIAANGMRLEADCRIILPRGNMIFSGHIHKPQACGPVFYVGAPYHVSFGEAFVPRVIVYDTDAPKEFESIETNLTRKWTIPFSSPEELAGKLSFVNANDQVKLRYMVPTGQLETREVEVKARELVKASLVQFEAWTEQSKQKANTEADKSGLDILPEEIVREFLTEKRLDDLVPLALEILAGRESI